MREHGAAEPDRVGEQAARGECPRPTTLLEVPDRGLDRRMIAMEGIGGDRVELDARDERVMAPGRKELLDGPVHDPGPAHHEAELARFAPGLAPTGDVGRLGGLGFSAVGVGDLLPGVLADRIEAAWTE